MAALNDDDIVISGLSGRFPESDNVEELWENLINHVNMVTGEGRRWNPDFLINNHKTGKIKDIGKFDVDFFSKKIHGVNNFSCAKKLLIERTYEAIVDSGRSVQSLDNTRTEVIAACNDVVDPEIRKFQIANDFSSSIDNVGSIAANLVSYIFNLKGESYVIDTACSSGLMAIQLAVDSLKIGRCEYAIVVCSQIAIFPKVVLALDGMGTGSLTGSCKSYDEAADGYVRSDSVIACFLEKAKTAKRVYCSALSCLTNTNGFNIKGIVAPSQEMQVKLYEETINSIGINCSDVTYVEGHGTGTVAGDYTEISSLYEAYCKNREKPLFVGSIKSNLGHTEISSGMCGLTKAILIMEKGIIPANINFKKPSSKIPALQTGIIKIVSENIPWKEGLISVNSLGVGGTNTHAILRPNLKEKSVDPVEKKRKLFAFTSRTKEGLEVMMDYLENNPDPNLYALLSSSVEDPDPNMFWKGFTILNSKVKVRKMELTTNEKSPICFAFFGHGSKWLTMGRDLLEIDIFRESMTKNFEILKKIGCDFGHLMDNQTGLEEIMLPWQSTILLTALQIAFTDLLRLIEINPDYIIGYSTGEIACAYADGCITREQAMLLSYHTAITVFLKKGSNPDAASKHKHADEGERVSGQNSSDSVSLAEKVDKINKIKEKELDSYEYPFHCKALEEATEKLLKEFSKIIPYPKPRSSKWISTSIPEKDWGSDLAKSFSAEYLTNNFEEPVLFYEGLQHIPKNSIFIEVSSHNILTPLLKRTAGMDAKYITFMEKNADNVNVILSNIGEMYLAGLKPKFSKLYPAVSFPVPRGTPMISPLLRWDYSQPQRCLTMQDTLDFGFDSVFIVELHRGMFSFVIDHNIRGQVFFPAAGYLFLAWHQFALHNFSKFDQTPVVFEDVHFLRGVILTKSENEGSECLKTRYLKKTGRFEIYHNEEVCVVGTVRTPKADGECSQVDLTDIEIVQTMISKEDIYKEFRLLGYNYGNYFQGLVSANLDGTVGKLKWTDNWISFIDSMLQLLILASDTHELFLPTQIDYLYIDPARHRECIAACDDSEILVMLDPYEGKIQSGAIIGRGAIGTMIPKAEQMEKAILEEYKFVPYFDDRCLKDLTQLEDDLKQYNAVCEEYIKRIIKSVKKVPDNLVRKYRLDSQTDFDAIKSSGQRFLQSSQFKPYLLQQIVNRVESSQEVSKVFSISDLNYEEEGDFLLSAFLNELILRSTLDVTMENITSATVNVLQISSPNVWLTKNLNSLFQSYSDRKVNYTIVKTNDVPVQLEEMDFVEWNVASSSFGSTNTDIIISYHTLSQNNHNLNSTVMNIRNSLKEGGFAVLIEPKDDSIIGYFLNDFQSTSFIQQKDLVDSFKAANLEIVAQKSDGILNDVYLLRNISAAGLRVIPVAIEDDNFEKWVPQLQDSLKKLQETDDKGNIWLITRNSPTSGIIGLTQSLAKEPPYGDRIRCLFQIRKDNSQVITEKQEIPKDIVKKDLLINIYQNGQWGSLRSINIKKDFKLPLSNAVLKIKKPGNFGSFFWCEEDIDEQLKSKKMEAFSVYYAGICYQDVISAKRTLEAHTSHGSPGFGYDFSGRNTEGTRVMGISVSPTLATCIACESKYTWTVPAHWTLAEAATVPLAYTLVYFALNVKGNLNIREKILIHCGSGAVGQAAINLALSMSCEVYVTVGSEEKKRFLKKEYPTLKEQNILNSSDLSFESKILKSTKGKGVDVILNSLTEEKMIASLRCLAQHGRFLNIGNGSLSSDYNLDLLLHKKEFFDVRFESLFENAYYFQEVEKMFTSGLKKGIVKPIHSTVFEKENIEDAFLLMQENHIGKVVVKIRNEEFINKIIQPPMLCVPTSPKVGFPADGTIIVVGGLGGFGMELTQWLVNRGARNLVLNSRSGIKNGYQERCVHKCRKSGVNVQISNQNLLDEDCVVDLVKKANDMAPVIGIFNLALVLEDDLMPKQTPEKFRRVTDVKIKITRNLDKISRSCCPQLKYFVMFSSIAARGSPSQSNYAYGNAAMERICELRRDAGLPGLSIQWGLVGDVGYVHERFGDDIQMGGLIPQRLSSCLATLDTFLNQKSAVLSSYVVAKTVSDKGGKHQKIDFEEFFKSQFSIDGSSLDKNTPLINLGLDSMAAIEFKSVLENNWNISLSFQDLSTVTVAKIEELIKQNINK